MWDRKRRNIIESALEQRECKDNRWSLNDAVPKSGVDDNSKQTILAQTGNVDISDGEKGCICFVCSSEVKRDAFTCKECGRVFHLACHRTFKSLRGDLCIFCS
jgi:hypothetical protein